MKVQKLRVNKYSVKMPNGKGKTRHAKGEFALDEAVSRFFISNNVPSSFQKPRN